jgi:ABC-2 type transport system ATP-binding protein
VDCPTDYFKQSIRKVTVEFDRAAPPFPGCPGLVSSRATENRLELILVGFGPEQQAAVETLGPRSVESHDLSLEDAFVEYTRGPRRQMPLLLGEPADD